MRINNVKVNIKRATGPLLILTLLLEQDMYGYQISQELSIRSDSKITITENSIYSILYRLEQQGFISSKSVLVGKRRHRSYYHLETEGREHLKQLRQEYCCLQQGIMQILNFGHHSPDNLSTSNQHF